MHGEPRSHLGAPTSEASGVRRLRQRASEMILSASSLTDELTDDEARPLIDWGVRQAEAAADDLAQASQAGGAQAVQRPGDVLAERLEAVRRIMKRMNRLVARRQEIPAEEVQEELQRLLSLAGDLPRPPSLNIGATSLAELGVAQSDLGNEEFVRDLVLLLADTSEGGQQNESSPFDRVMTWR